MQYFIEIMDRAVRTAAQTAVGVLGADYAGVFDVPWQGVVGASALAALTSLLTSVAASGLGRGTPSLAEEPLPEAPYGRHAAQE